VSEEKRRTQRIEPFVAPCRVVVEGSRRVPGYLADLSPKGARVACDIEPPKPGVAVVLEVRFGRQVRYSRIPAEVKWANPAPDKGTTHWFGLTFTGISADEQAALDSVVDEFQRRASQLA
jgi:hypothetical protein